MENNSLTIDEIIAVEPRIGRILKNARRNKRADWEKYERYKMRLLPLVGFGAVKKSLRTCEAYEVTIHELCNKLRI